MKENTGKDNTKPSGSWFHRIAPGVLVAATGVGAGDLITAGLGGSAVGLIILWAAAAGAILKWFLNEGIARWQMATNTTLLEGWIHRLGNWVQWVFLIYFIPWSFFTGGALVNACGIAGTGMFALNDDLKTSKIIWGVVHSLVGLVLVRVGGFKLFEKMMAACIAMMFVAVILTALMLKPDWSMIARGLTSFSIPEGSMGWVLGILGGVGGTVTLLSYGYWIRELDRSGLSGVKACRFDLMIGYTMTALFGISMVVIGSNLNLEKGSGGLANLAITLADQLGAVLGAPGKWLFLIGFWGAVFSSLLGVWQSVPYLFADFLQIRKGKSGAASATIPLNQTQAYKIYLVAIAIIPLPLLMVSVKQIQLIYAIMGSFFMPLLSLTLLLMNNRTAWVGRQYRNGWITNIVLIATLLFFGYVGVNEIAGRLGY